MKDHGFVHKFVKGKSARTLLLLHGTGGNELDLVPVAELIDPDASIISPRGKVLENGMPRYFKRLAEGVFDVEDLKFRTHELARFVEEASREYRFSLERLTAVGYSNGANIGASLMLLEPSVLAGAVLFRAMLPFQPDNRPKLSGKHVFISSGRYDTITPIKRVLALADLLKESGAGVTWSTVESSHSLAEQDIEAARRWQSSRVEKG